MGAECKAKDKILVTFVTCVTLSLLDKEFID